MTTKVVKNRFFGLREPLQYLLDMLLRTGRFPDSFKKVQVTPLLKASDSPKIFSNYKPVSVSHCFQKF